MSTEKKSKEGAGGGEETLRESQATAEGRFPDISQLARVEERERRLNELRETYLRKKIELDFEYLNALKQLEQEYSDLPPALATLFRDADTLII
jgi:hypothetical protein